MPDPAWRGGVAIGSLLTAALAEQSRRSTLATRQPA